MKTIGLILSICGVLILLAGLIATVVNVTDKYAPTICDRAAADKQKFRDAKMICKDVTSDCYRRTVAGLTDDDDCSYAKSYRTEVVTVSAVVAAVGLFSALIGLVFMRRKSKTVST